MPPPPTTRTSRRRASGARLVLFAASLGVCGATWAGETPAVRAVLLEPFTTAPTWLLLGVIAAVLAMTVFRARVDRALASTPRLLIDAVIFAVAFAIVHRATLQVFHGLPQISDEIAYDLIGRRIAAGDPFPRSPPLPEFFRARFLVDEGGGSYSLFQPGWPLLLALARKAGDVTAAPAFATASLVVAASRIADRFYGRFASVVTAALLIGSGFIDTLGATFFAHAWASALACVAWWQLDVAFDPPWRARRSAIVHAMVAGLAFSWLFATRLPTATSAAIAIVALASPRLVERHRHALAVATTFVAFALLGPIAQLVWNRMTTGHPFVLPQDRYFDLTEPIEGCHRIGFGIGIGCPREHPKDALTEGLTFARAVVVTRMRLHVLWIDAWGSPWPLVASLMILGRGLRAREAFLGIAIVATIAVYFGFYFHGIIYGARFYAELMAPLAIVIAAGISDVGAAGDAWVARIPSFVWMVVIALVVRDEQALVVPSANALYATERRIPRMVEALDAAQIHNAVVYVGNCRDADSGDLGYGEVSALNEVPASGDRIFVRDWGAQQDAQLVPLFPTRSHVRVDCGGALVETLPNAPTDSPRVVWTEAESKFPVPAREHAYASIRDAIDGSMGAVLQVELEGPGGSVGFDQRFAVAGRYRMTMKVLAGNGAGTVVVWVDGKEIGPSLWVDGERDANWASTEPIAITAGVHRIELRELEGDRGLTVPIDWVSWVAE